MAHPRRTIGTVLLLSMTFVAEGWGQKPLPKKAPPPTSASKFLHIRRDADKRPVALETSIARYVFTDPNRQGIVVDLIGAIHVGEKEYYDTLNQEFAKYEALLYELVAPPNVRIPRGGAVKDRSPISQLQIRMKEVLDLEFQLEHVDYTKANFVHADLSPDEFAKSMEAKGETFLSILMRLMQQAMVQQSKQSGASEFALLFAFLSENRALAIKRVLADQFEDFEATMEAFSGPEGSTLITERNKRAMDVLEKELRKGKRRIAIFYGAGHMPDMEKQLKERFGVKKASERWLVAWDLRTPAERRAKPPATPANAK